MEVKRELDPGTLLQQRWFAGKHRRLERVLDAGELRLAGGGLRLAEARYADTDESELYLLTDPGIDWPRSLRQLTHDALTGSAGTLRLRLGPGVDVDSLPLSGPGRAATPSLDQSNTLLTVDEALLIKIYRRLRAGVHPEVEIGEALAGTDAPVARHYGALELLAPDGSVTAIGCLQEFIAGAEGGWEWPIAIAMSDLRAGRAASSTLDLASGCGLALARLHADMARALGTSSPGVGDEAEYRMAMAALTDLTGVDAVSTPAMGVLGHRLTPLLHPAEPAQRIHGDLHIGQFLRRGEELTVIDFEGNPTLELDARRAPGSPLRDLATLRCSFDHVATAAARRVGPPPSVTAAWSERVLAEVMRGYQSGGGAVENSAPRLHAFEVAAELRELQYARSVLPEWAYVAHAGIQRLLADGTPPPGSPEGGEPPQPG